MDQGPVPGLVRVRVEEVGPFITSDHSWKVRNWTEAVLLFACCHLHVEPPTLQTQTSFRLDVLSPFLGSEPTFPNLLTKTHCCDLRTLSHPPPGEGSLVSSRYHPQRPSGSCCPPTRPWTFAGMVSVPGPPLTSYYTSSS